MLVQIATHARSPSCALAVLAMAPILRLSGGERGLFSAAGPERPCLEGPGEVRLT